MLENTITAGGLTTLVIQLIKFIWRKFVKKDMAYEFPSLFYQIIIPILNILVQPILALLGIGTYLMPTDWVGYLRIVALTLISSLVSVFAYEGAIRPLKG